MHIVRFIVIVLGMGAFLLGGGPKVASPELVADASVVPSVARRAALPGDRLQVRGRVVDVLDAHFFRLAGPAEPESLLVIAATPHASPSVGETVVVRGVMRRFRPEPLRRHYGWSGWAATEDARRRSGEMAMFAHSVHDSRGFELLREGPPAESGRR